MSRRLRLVGGGLGGVLDGRGVAAADPAAFTDHEVAVVGGEPDRNHRRSGILDRDPQSPGETRMADGRVRTGTNEGRGSGGELIVDQREAGQMYGDVLLVGDRLSAATTRDVRPGPGVHNQVERGKRQAKELTGADERLFEDVEEF
jgi:hypothetical protein